MDTKLRIPLESNILKTAKEYKTLIACSNITNDLADKVNSIRSSGAEVVALPDENNKVSIEKLLKYLGDMKIDSVLVEGGGEVHEAFLKAGAINHVKCYIAPKIFGGANAKTPVEGLGIEKVNEALVFSKPKITALGDDFLVECERIK